MPLGSISKNIKVVRFICSHFYSQFLNHLLDIYNGGLRSNHFETEDNDEEKDKVGEEEEALDFPCQLLAGLLSFRCTGCCSSCGNELGLEGIELRFLSQM